MDNREFKLKSRTINSKIATSESLDAFRLVEAYNEGKLTGKLKELAAELEEESNPIIMLVKYKM